MALIPCYECEKEISDQAPACPHCGAPKEEQPPQIEEAEILESVAVVDETEGYLLRRDIHRLFDRGDIAVYPDTCRVNVGCSLSVYPVYGALGGQPLHVRLTRRQRTWLTKHWE